jgi:hypothetical protein
MDKAEASVGWAKAWNTPCPPFASVIAERWWARRFAPLPTLRLLCTNDSITYPAALVDYSRQSCRAMRLL